MFSKSKINEPGPKQANDAAPLRPAVETLPAAPEPAETPRPASARSKPPASMISADLTIKGDIKTTGDVQIEGNVEGDIRAHLLIVGEAATITGEVMADDVVVNGRIVGCVRGLKVRLTSTARVEGDIIHKTIAIEAGAHFEGSVARRDDPLNTGAAQPEQQPAPKSVSRSYAAASSGAGNAENPAAG